MNCPFCQQTGAELFHRDRNRDFLRCPVCTIIFVPRSSILAPAEEKKRYEAHNNDEADPAYRDYFLKTALPVMKNVNPGSSGLDFGCGRTILMEKIFREHGFTVDSYDPYFFPDEQIWNRSFGFIVMNEVIEHLSNPAGTLDKLSSLLRGPLFVRTKLYPEKKSDFADWFYKRDLTHVQFFSLEALGRLGNVTVLGEDLYRIDVK